jgi:3-oxoacyl-[acyl-carrier protein] reductase
MSSALKDKTALVTGGSHGIGRAIAERFGRDGATVGIGYSRDEAAAREVVAGIRERGGTAFALHAELGVPGDAARFWAAADEHTGGKVDIVVHNAAKGSFKNLADLTEEEFDQVMATSVKAPFFLTKQALPRLRDGGRIITISSLASRLASPNMIAYSAAKGALDAFTLSLAKELGPRGITVNAVSPGVTLTRNNQQLRGNKDVIARVALGRLGEPDDIAGVVAFIASDDGRWITGQILDASGGTAL